MAFSYLGGGGQISLTSKRKPLALKKISNLPFLRGLFYLFWGLWQFFEYLTLSLKLSNLYAKPKQDIADKTSKRLAVDVKVVVWSIIGVVSFALCFAGLSFLPAIIVRALPIASPQIVLNVLLGVFKVAFLYLLVCTLRLVWPLRCFFSLNAAANQATRCLIDGDESAKDISKKSIYLSTNFLTYCFFCFVLHFFVLSLLVDVLSFWATLAISIVALVAIFDFGFEVLKLCQKQKSIVTKAIVVAFSFPFVCQCSKTELELASSSVIEVCLMDEMKNREGVELLSKGRAALSAVLTDAKNALAAVGIDDVSEAEWLVATVLDCNRAELKLKTTISSDELAQIKAALARRINHEPLSKIFGFADFYGRRFVVNQHVLSPRMETEEVVERCIKVIKQNDYRTVLDVCTGSGIIAITIAKETNCDVVALDVSKHALEVAQKNAKKMQAKVDFLLSDMFAGLKKRKKFDIIVSNPPYLQTNELELCEKEVKNFDPTLALDGGEDGLDFYRRIARDAPFHLQKGGCLVLEIHSEKAAQTKKILSQNFENIKVFKDNFKKDRIIVAYLKG